MIKNILDRYKKLVGEQEQNTTGPSTQHFEVKGALDNTPTGSAYVNDDYWTEHIIGGLTSHDCKTYDSSCKSCKENEMERAAKIIPECDDNVGKTLNDLRRYNKCLDEGVKKR
jgi:hypothetical protein